MIRKCVAGLMGLLALISGDRPVREASANAPVNRPLEPTLQARAREVFGPDQGVYFVAEDGRVLVAIEPDRPLIPASLSKIPATTAILGRLDPDHRFRGGGGRFRRQAQRVRDEARLWTLTGKMHTFEREMVRLGS